MKLNFGKKNDEETAAQAGQEAAQAASENAAEFAADVNGVAAVNREEKLDLTKLKKKDLLEIMLRQGEEIDALRAQVEDLQARLDNKEFELSKVGSIAEASLAVTEIFKEADKAAMIYLTNLKRMAEEGMKNE